MIIVNFAHPLDQEQRRQIEAIARQPILDVLDVASHLDHERPVAEQVASIVDRLPLSSEQWQIDGVIVNPPSYAPIVCALLAELHGRIGCFPAILRLRPVEGAVPPRFEVAELVDLQAIRDNARAKR